MKRIKNDLILWKSGIDSDKEIFFEEIKEKVNEHLLSKIDAIRLITEYELLPVEPWIFHPDFMDELGFGDYCGKREVIYYYNWFCAGYFLPPDGTEVSPYALFPDITLDEAINETYDFMLKHKVRGCIFDW